MAHYHEHCGDCKRILGHECGDVNHWMDAAFRQFGPRHRFDRHHWEGVAKAQELFGERGRQAAIIHILRDCGHIPHAEDYKNGNVDVLGFDQSDEATGYFNGYWDAIAFREAVTQYLPELRIT